MTVSNSIKPCAMAILLGALSWGAPIGVSTAVAGTDFSEVSRLTLLPGWQRDDGMYFAAIQIDLDPGWKTYWRAPGGDGIAPEFDWSGSDNIAQVGYVWPTPDVFRSAYATTIGYKTQLVLPILIKPANPDAPIMATVDATYGVCEDVCVPASGSAHTSMQRDARHNIATITSALGLRSTPADQANVSGAECTLTPNGQDFVLNTSVHFSDSPVHPEVVMIESGAEMIWISQPDYSVSNQSLIIEADMQYYGEGDMDLDHGDLRFTLIGNGTSIDVRGCTPR